MKRTISAGLAACVLLCISVGCVANKSAVYTFRNSGAQFMVPTGWQEIWATQDQSTTLFAFESTKQKGVSIHCYCTDVWSELPDAQKQLMPRENMDTLDQTPAEIAVWYGCSQEDVSMVSYGKETFYCAEIDLYHRPGTYLVCCENGYRYTFMFAGGDAKHQQFSDFKKIVSSVVYP